MVAPITYYRNKITGTAYKKLLKPIFFRNDPETIHDRMTRLGAFLGKSSIGRSVTTGMLDFKDPSLEQNILGIEFKNPIGLSAGFDKNAELTEILPAVGFGFTEVGSVTGYPCDGNPKPRLWRLPESKSLVVYYGLKNDGCEAISTRLDEARESSPFNIPVGISVAMTNCAANADTATAIEDYAKAFETMESLASYITVNISCPNTSGGQPFTDPGRLERLLTRLDKSPTKKPVFIKLSPDLSLDGVDELVKCAERHNIQGIVCTNLTKKRNNPKILDSNVPEKGGLSGNVVKHLSDNLVSHIYRSWGKRFVLVGSGGVFSAEDAYKKIRLGASLIQLITGMIYEGPQLISEINRGLVELLKRDGFSNISEAVGLDAEKC